MNNQAFDALSFLSWDAQNRLRALSDDGYVSLYWYDADGDVWYWNGYSNEFIGFGTR